jgi:hypothetical protein
VYWSAFDERDSMTINAHCVEYLDLFAIVDGEPSEIFNRLPENISKLKSYINSDTFTDTSLRQSFNARIEALSSRYRSAEDIPRIITQDANYGWRIPGERYYLPMSEAETSRPIMIDGNIPIEIGSQPLSCVGCVGIFPTITANMLSQSHYDRLL